MRADAIKANMRTEKANAPLSDALVKSMMILMITKNDNMETKPTLKGGVSAGRC